MAEPVDSRKMQVAGDTGYGSVKARMLNGLALVLVLATGVVLSLYLIIAVNPTVSLNPFPPHVATAALVGLPELEAPEEMVSPPFPVSAPTSFPTPTPLIPFPLMPTPGMTFPFTVAVETDPGGISECRAVIAGMVTDQEGRGLEGYPVHLWAAETEFASYETVLFSDETGQWQVVLPAGAYGVWYVQLHAPDAGQVYPPLSPIVAVTLPEACPRARVIFQAGHP
ncbi:MAG: hypothetical protein ACPLYD_13205 [Anaerolineae bacterium]